MPEDSVAWVAVTSRRRVRLTKWRMHGRSYLSNVVRQAVDLRARAFLSDGPPNVRAGPSAPLLAAHPAATIAAKPQPESARKLRRATRRLVINQSPRRKTVTMLVLSSRDDHWRKGRWCMPESPVDVSALLWARTLACSDLGAETHRVSTRVAVESSGASQRIEQSNRVSPLRELYVTTHTGLTLTRLTTAGNERVLPKGLAT